MPWGYAIAAVGTYLGSRESNKGSGKAADASEHAAQLQVDEQRRQFDITQGNLAPWLQAGGWGLGQQQAFLKGDFSGFENSPDYKYTLQEGIGGIDHSAAAHGGLFGGGHTRDVTRFASGLATQNMDNYYRKLTGLSQTGYDTGNTLGQLGQQSANAISNAYGNAGNARASAYQAQGNANANMWNNLGQIGASYFGNRNGYGG